MGIPISIGVAPTKTLAKMANRYANKKRNSIGVHCLFSEDAIDYLLKNTSIGDVWGVGSMHRKKMEQIGIKTAYDFTKLPKTWVKKKDDCSRRAVMDEIERYSSHRMVATENGKKSDLYSTFFW